MLMKCYFQTGNKLNSDNDLDKTAFTKQSLDEINYVLSALLNLRGLRLDCPFS